MNRKNVRPVALLGTTVLVAGLVAAAAPAQAADRPSLKTITNLPRTDHPGPDGNGPAGRGTVRLNTAVANACHEGNPISAPQWYFVGERTTGSLRVSARAAENTLPLGLARVATGTAIVDHWSGEVLTCSTEAFSRFAKPVDVVAYLLEPFPGTEYGGGVSGEFTVFVDRIASRAPADDRVEDATSITGLPFRASVDTSRADADGPALVAVDPFEPSTAPAQGGTIWYRYSPATDGPAPAVSVTATTNWVGANARGAAGLRSGFFERLPGGGTVLLEGDGADPPLLASGKDYLLGVAYTWDAYDEDVLATGGPLTVSVTAR